MFGKQNKPDNEEDEDAEDAEADGHDPHFEPIIPLPELVEVKTGEEEEELVFKHRAKVYRYCSDTKQWKERGIIRNVSETLVAIEEVGRQWKPSGASR